MLKEKHYRLKNYLKRLKMTKNTFYPIDNRTLEEIHSWVQLGKEPILEPNLPIVDPHHH